MFEIRLIEDSDGARAWIRVLDAIAELQATAPAEGEAVH
jgi:hypothetical protein